MRKTLCIFSCVLWGISVHAQTLTGTLGAIGVAGILQGIGSNAGSIGMGAVNGMQQGLPGLMGGNTPGLGGIGGGGTGGVRPPGGTGGGATTTPAPTPPTPTPTPTPTGAGGTSGTRRPTGVLNLRGIGLGGATSSAVTPRVQRISLRAGGRRIAPSY